jgi:hypothetical protein
MQPFKVMLADAENFSKVWKYNGISLPISSEYCQFATDYANVVLSNFIAMCQEQARAAANVAQNNISLSS